MKTRKQQPLTKMQETTVKRLQEYKVLRDDGGPNTFPCAIVTFGKEIKVYIDDLGAVRAVRLL